MSTQPTSDGFEQSAFSRCALGVTGATLVGLLCVAANLQPEPRGRGTHQQLGLPPCTFVMLWGKPCPTCGMTTSWANVVRGRFPAAVRANLGGTLLALLAMVSGPCLLLSAIRGKPVFRLPGDATLIVIAATLMTVTLLHWVCRLWSGG